MVPHLITAQSGPINELEERILESMPAIERWFRLEWMEHTPPFYSAVDVRNAGFKLAPMDTVLHPQAFNQLDRAMLPLAVQAAMAAIEKICPEAKNLLLIPEAQVRDAGYLSHLSTLVRIFRQAGLNVRLGSLDADIQSPTPLRTLEGEDLVLEPLLRQRGRLGLKDFDPCTILLNSELAGGVPQLLKHLDEQYLLPPLHAAWAVRRRSQHFRAYDELAKRFAKLLGMDPWLINPMFGQCDRVNEGDGSGLACAQTQVDAVLSKIRRKYKDYGITERPFVVLKADDGSQRLAGVTVYDAKDLEALNLGQGAPSEMLIQEGVPTRERVDAAAAEPVVYMMDRYVVGGFYRLHAERRPDEDLNVAGARFEPLAFAQAAQLPRPGGQPGASVPNRFYMYGVVARLAMLAASYELEAADPEREELEASAS
ncbi:glutamate--cysteine ligase [Inhella inkyongensis]|uniref:Glutamate--cysteine ligase n=1 Tax=Inhella inkyongensis TaxID=392593 RepID=A0A840S7S6_9BURK|nr:glutamate--cysteine ligase [Inhella inkyongensis]MBB5205723.1 glutamate--cysteine ligase [Inhella inkyongensis]